MISLIKDNLQVAKGAKSDDLNLIWFAGQLFMMTGIAFYRTAKCWNSNSYNKVEDEAKETKEEVAEEKWILLSQINF